MKDKFGIELLKTEFSGTGSQTEETYSLIERNLRKGLYKVVTEFELRYEVILFRLSISFITKKPLEYYPSEKSINKHLWKFEKLNEAKSFYDKL